MQIILRLYQVEEELISVPPPHAPPRPLPHFALPQPSSTPTSPALCSTSAFIFVSASAFPPSSFKGRKEASHQISIEVVSEAVLGELLTDGAERTHAHMGIPQRRYHPELN